MVPPSEGRPGPPAALGERFLELTADIAGVLGFDGRITSANPALTRMLGARLGVPAARHAGELLHDHDRAVLGALWRDLVGGRRDTGEAEVRVRIGGGRERWFLVSLVADRAARLVYLIGKDVEESRLAIAALGDAEARFRSAFEASAIGVTITGLDLRYISVNAAYARTVGRTVEELIGAHIDLVSHPDEAPGDRETVNRMVACPGEVVMREKRYLRPDGTEVIGLISVSAVADPDGTARYLISQLVDITQQRAAERALAESERRFRTLATASPAGIFSADRNGTLRYANDRLAEIFGMSVADMDGWRWLDRVEPASREPLLQVTEAVAGGGSPVALDVRLDGEPADRWVRVNLAAVRDGTEGDGFVGTIEDVTAEVRARTELAAREAEFRALADHAGDFLSRHDMEGRYLYASPAAEAILGRPPEALVGRSVWELDYIHPEDVEAVRGVELDADGTATFEWRVVRPDGSVGWLETAVRAVPDPHGTPTQLVAVTRDVSERKEAERRLAHQALHDALTGLPNRVLFLDRLQQALNRARRSGRDVAVLFVDLDRFKLINDSFGHSAGDRLLCEVAARLRGTLRPADTLSRFGGDELTILCEDLDGEAGARRIAQRIATLFETPFAVEDGEAYLQASVGIAMAADGATPEDLIRDADAAMYRAKERGRARVEVFDEAMRNDARERVATESALRRAIERGDLRLHAQPVVGLADEHIEGFEALVRWEHAERGLIPPAEFIPLAEETGLVVAIGNWMLREACRTLRRWEDEVGADWVQIGVNLSQRHLQQPELVGTVRAALEDHDLDPDRLILEITESAVMENGGGTIETLRALKALGVRLAIDDFGTGYSSLAHLHRFPIDVLKIDRSFTAALGGEGGGASIAGAIVSLSRALGLTTVAEGIENEAQKREVRRLGSAFGQGFLFARPQPPEAFDTLLRGGSPAAGGRVLLAR